MTTTLNINVFDEVKTTVLERVVFVVKKTFTVVKNVLTKGVLFVSANGNKAPPAGARKGGKKKA